MKITLEKINELNKKFMDCRVNRVAQNAAMQNGIEKAAVNREIDKIARHNFSISLKQGKITDQKNTGRCWMFSALNIMRYRIIRDLNLETFELSQSYPLFFDKLERSNYFLQSIVETLNEDVNSRVVKHLLTDPMGDGGQWDMFVNLVKKYGVVPKDVMPESANSSSTARMDEYLTKALRKYACEIRKAHVLGKSRLDIEGMISNYMENIYNILCVSLGTPPTKFDFEVRDKDNNYILDREITPLEYFDKYVNMNLDEYVSLINAPTKDKPYGKMYTVKFLGNVVEGKKVAHLNLEIEKLKKAAIAQMQDGEPVWFGCDVGQYFYREGSVLDTQALEMGELFGVDFSMSKEDRLDYSESLMTHAMVFMGVDIVDEKSTRWRVENSWGKDSGNEGYLCMTDRWFDEYMYQIVVNKKYLDEEDREKINQELIELDPWDPMGSLAK